MYWYIGEAANTRQTSDNLAGASANATKAVAGLAVNALSVSTSALDQAVRGVDIVNITFDRESCKVVSPSSRSLASWLASGANIQLPPGSWQFFADTISSLHWWVPHVVQAHDVFSADGSYVYY